LPVPLPARTPPKKKGDNKAKINKSAKAANLNIAVLTQKAQEDTGCLQNNNCKNFNIMKTLQKLKINAEKVIKNEELVNLKGGAYVYDCYCNGKYLGEATSPSICDSRCASCTECW